MNLYDDLYRRAQEAPDRPALYFEDGRAFAFGEIHSQCLAAAALLSECGIGQADRVALNLQNSPELTFLLFGAWWLGAVPVTLNPAYKTQEVDHALSVSKPMAMFVADEEMAAHVRDAHRETAVHLFPTGRRLAPATAEALATLGSEPIATEPGAEAAILFTGGSTGAPKAVSITHDGFAQSVAVQASASKGGRKGPFPIADLGAPSNMVAVPLFHMLGQKQLLFSFHVGRSVVLLERFRPKPFLAAAKRFGVDNFVLLPTMVYDMAFSDEDLDLSSIRHILVGGQPLSAEVRRRFEERYHVPILSIYGSTEAGSIAGWTSADLREGKWKPGSVGRVFAGVTLRIVDSDGADVAPGATGEIWVRAKIAAGYLDEAAGSLLREGGWVATGDLGYLDADGVLFLTGRQREMIKCGGFQVFPLEIEEALRGHPWVRDVAVLGVPDDRLGEAPRAFVVLTDEASADSSIPTLMAYSREVLAGFKAVRSIEIVAALPRNDIGKIEKHRLLESAA